MSDAVRSEAATKLLNKPSLSEAMIISTCNRLEVYTVASSFHPGVQDVVNVLHEASGVDIDTLRGYLYVRYADAAAEHMLTVTAGLDSMVVGEQQIIGQMRGAYQEAIEAGTVGPALHSLAQAALRTGKRVHSETQIDDAGASMVTYAVDRAMGKRGLKSLHGKRALILGAGAMASLAATYLGKQGISQLLIANRSEDRAERLAEHAREAGVEAQAVSFAHRSQSVPEVDIVVSATGANDFTVEPRHVDKRKDHLILIDLSMPRDIDPMAGQLQGVELVNIEQLSQEKEDTAGPQEALAQRIVAEELGSYTSVQRVREVVPAVAALRRHAASVTTAEIERLRARTPEMSERDFDEVSRTVRRVVDKLLHQPTVRIKQLAVTSGVVSYDSVIQELFGVDPETETDKSVATWATALPNRDFKQQIDDRYEEETA